MYEVRDYTNDVHELTTVISEVGMRKKVTPIGTFHGFQIVVGRNALLLGKSGVEPAYMNLLNRYLTQRGWYYVDRTGIVNVPNGTGNNEELHYFGVPPIRKRVPLRDILTKFGRLIDEYEGIKVE